MKYISITIASISCFLFLFFGFIGYYAIFLLFNFVINHTNLFSFQVLFWIAFFAATITYFFGALGWMGYTDSFACQIFGFKKYDLAGTKFENVVNEVTFTRINQKLGTDFHFSDLNFYLEDCEMNNSRVIGRNSIILNSGLLKYNRDELVGIVTFSVMLLITGSQRVGQCEFALKLPFVAIRYLCQELKSIYNNNQILIFYLCLLIPFLILTLTPFFEQLFNISTKICHKNTQKEKLKADKLMFYCGFDQELEAFLRRQYNDLAVNERLNKIRD